MRDPKRINRICDKLKELWKCYPDERFGQLITNHLFDDGNDPFFKEDYKESWMKKDYETWEDKIDKQISRHRLWERVLVESEYKKDHDKWFKKLLNSGRINTSKLWDKEPKWEDYIDKLETK